jgi:hypothetical protein
MRKIVTQSIRSLRPYGKQTEYIERRNQLAPAWPKASTFLVKIEEKADFDTPSS